MLLTHSFTQGWNRLGGDRPKGGRERGRGREERYGGAVGRRGRKGEVGRSDREREVGRRDRRERYGGEIGSRGREREVWRRSEKEIGYGHREERWTGGIIRRGREWVDRAIFIPANDSTQI